MPEKTQQFAQNIARSLIGEEAAHPAQPLIQMQGIRKSYYIGQPNELEILHGIDLTVYPGEFVAIVGESGSGKSTLMNIIGVLDKPTAGEYVLDGVNIHDADDNDLAAIRNRKIGFVFQTYNLIGRQSALKNVELPMLYAGVPAGERTRRAKEWLERVGMGERMRHQPNELSGGQKQRVAIARALANKPQVLLSDEATSALDPDATEAILNLLRDLNRKLGLTIVLITHEMAVIKSICQRVAVMENGRVVEEGDVYDIFAHPRAAITRKFVSSASALSKVDKLMEEGSTLVRPTANQKLVRLTFHKDCVGEHVISTVSRDFGVDINIVLANVEVIEDNPLGGMIALLGGEEKQVAAALNYLNENHVYTEVIADGSI